MSNDKYVSPLSERYASKEMQYIFSPDMKFKTWRKLWIALAETEKELGLNITQEQIDELKAHADDINYDVAKAREKEVRHDVMSHVYAYGVQCPKAKGIIHLGATSCYVGDNTDIILMSEALEIVRKKLINVIAELAKFADEHKNLPTLAFTHFQPAQPTTVGKRATLWMMELKLDLDDLEYLIGSMRLLGSKGTTGTQASFLELFDGDQETIDKIDPMIAEKMGFKECYPVSGQTYSRKVDTRVLNILAGIAQDGKSFFYVNPLEIKPRQCMPHTSRAHVKARRQKWFGVACCPPNIARTLASLGQYIYGVDGADIYTHLYIGNQTDIPVNNDVVQIRIDSMFPWNGNIKVKVQGVKEKIKLHFRIPSYSENFQLYCNGEEQELKVNNGYAYVEICENSRIDIQFDMPVAFLHANYKVSADVGKVAIKRGPIVYCLEEIDNGPDLQCIYLSSKEAHVRKSRSFPECFEIELQGRRLISKSEGLYSSDGLSYSDVNIQAIPYAYWNNRREGEMLVWIHEIIG